MCQWLKLAGRKTHFTSNGFYCFIFISTRGKSIVKTSVRRGHDYILTKSLYIPKWWKRPSLRHYIISFMSHHFRNVLKYSLDLHLASIRKTYIFIKLILWISEFMLWTVLTQKKQTLVHILISILCTHFSISVQCERGVSIAMGCR